MPFTPYHLGPALTMGLPFRNYIHVPTFILANIIVDLEPFLVLLLNIYYYPLHGYAHTFLGAMLIGLILSFTMYVLRKLFNDVFRVFKLVAYEQNLKSYIIAGISGTFLHVLLDSPLYEDIKPLYPLNINPFYDPSIAPTIYGICSYLFLAGLTIYLIILFKEFFSN